MGSSLTKVWIFVVSTGLFFLIVGYQLGDRFGLLVGFTAAILLNALVFFFGDDRLIQFLDAKEVKGQDSFGLNAKIESIANQLNITAPRLFIFESNSPTSFCVGHTWHRSSLGISTALLKKLEATEVEAILVHQLCRISRLDTFRYSVSSTLANTIVGFGEFLDRLLPIKLFQTLLSPFGWIIIKTISRDNSFFLNDQKAASLIEDRYILGKTIWKLHGYSMSQPIEIPACTSHLFVVAPNTTDNKNIFLKAHPSIKKRINKLMGYYPL